MVVALEWRTFLCEKNALCRLCVNGDYAHQLTAPVYKNDPTSRQNSKVKIISIYAKRENKLVFQNADIY
jgi:hypothetical protein